KNRPRAEGQHLQSRSRHGAKSASGSEHPFPQHDKAAFPLQRQGTRAFFSPIKAFVESPGRVKRFPPPEHESPAGESRERHDDDFVRLTHGASGIMDRLQRAAKARLLVMRGNDE